MQGHELARRLLEKRPGLKVLFVSGYMPDQAVRDQMLQTGAPFLQKPFSPEALVGRIKELLNGKS
jgi:DNA-binding response OmpR family regulator